MSTTPINPGVSADRPSDREQYLWDPGTVPEAAVASVEARLATLAPTPGMLTLPGRAQAGGRRWFLRPLLAAAVLLAAAIGVYLIARSPARIGTWTIVSQSGQVALAGDPGNKSPSARIVTTGPDGVVHLRNGAGDSITLRPDSRLHTGGADQIENLRAGEVFVQTTAAHQSLAIKLGSGPSVVIGAKTAAMIAMTNSGGARVTIKTGHATINRGKGDVRRIPGEAVCDIRSGVGPGTPFYYDAPRELIDALSVIDAFTAGQKVAEKSLDVNLATALKAARPRDAMSLWNLLPRLGPDSRRLVAERMRELNPGAAKAADPGLERAEPAAMDAWWRAALPDE